MPHIVDWQSVVDPREIVGQAVRTLQAGKLVAFPTETVYGLAALGTIAEAVERLCRSKGRPQDKPLTVALGEPGEAVDWVPELNLLGQRLARRCWPGPLTLVSDAGVERGLLGKLPESVRQRIAPRGTVGLRVPSHEAILETLYSLTGPMILTSANQSGQPAALTAAEVLEAVGDEVELVIDDGPAMFGKASTVVSVSGEQWSILREGVLTADMLRRQCVCMIVFVCTGNTCRSPMAEAMCKKMLAERLNCGVGELVERGYLVQSAGVAAAPGCEAAREAQEVVAEKGANLSCHQSRPINWDMLTQADYLLAMTRGHLLALLEFDGGLARRARLLHPGGLDIPDPVGGDREVYQECAREIEHALQQWLTVLPR